MAEKKEPKTYDWKSPVSFSAKSMASIIREVLDERGHKYRREKGEKPYAKFMIVMPMPKFAYVFRFVVEDMQVKIQTYDTRPTHSGIIPYLEVIDISKDNEDEVKAILRGINDRLPRPAWKFTWGQRLQYALISTEYGAAKKAWKRMGFRVK